jgi:hypothetical protein
MTMKTPKASRILIPILLIALFLSACSAAATMSPQEAAPPSAPNESWSRDNDSFGESQSNYSIPGKPISAAIVDRVVIRTATLQIVVDDPALSMEAISRMADEMGGFVVLQNLSKTTGSNSLLYPQAAITIRVPSEKLNDALAQIKSQVKNPAEDVITENVTGQDVTREYTDLRSRLKNLQASEEQLREIMGSATKTQDVLDVQAQLTQVREQIEVIQGQITYYEEAAALSSIAVTLQARASIQPLEVGGWKPAGVARDALQALIYTLQSLAGIAIWAFVYLLPVGLVLGLPILLVVWFIRRAGRKNKPQLPPAQAAD